MTYYMYSGKSHDGSASPCWASSYTTPDGTLQTQQNCPGGNCISMAHFHFETASRNHGHAANAKALNAKLNQNNDRLKNGTTSGRPFFVKFQRIGGGHAGEMVYAKCRQLMQFSGEHAFLVASVGFEVDSNHEADAVQLDCPVEKIEGGDDSGWYKVTVNGVEFEVFATAP